MKFTICSMKYTLFKPIIQRWVCVKPIIWSCVWRILTQGYNSARAAQVSHFLIYQSSTCFTDPRRILADHSAMIQADTGLSMANLEAQVRPIACGAVFPP